VKRGRRRGQEKEVFKWRLALALEHSKHGLKRKEILERKTQHWISRRTETEVFDRMPQREVGLFGKKKNLGKEMI
jgi:flagellar biosynthesis chaperone FliJ